MNREIKFRGKRIDSKEWVYGCLVNNLWCYSVNSPYKGKKVCEIITDQFSVDDYEEMQANGMNVTVEPDTVGQFTTYRDQHGDEIFENDVCRDRFQRIIHVKWHNGRLQWCCYDPKNNFKWTDLWQWEIEGDKLSVVKIGNIHDNPELLKEGGQGE